MENLNTDTLRHLASKNNSAAQFRLAHHYFHQSPPDYSNVKRWLRRAFLCGHKDSALLLALMYHDGLGVEKNDEKALEYMLHAIRGGHFFLLNEVAREIALHKDIKAYTGENLDECVNAHLLANERETDLADYRYSIIFENEDEDELLESCLQTINAGGEENRADGVSILKSIADMGFPKASALYAEYLFATLSEGGDPHEMIPYLELSAELGEPKAQFLFGLCLMEGLGCEEDQELGRQWLKKASQSPLSKDRSIRADV